MLCELTVSEIELVSGGVDEDGGEIVVTAHRPEMVDLGNNFYGQFYSDGIAQVYHYEGGFLGIGGSYVPQGNYTYTIENGLTTTSTATTVSMTPSQTYTTTKTEANYKLTGRTDLP